MKGQIQQKDGRPAASFVVKAFDIDLGGEERLGEATTNEGGHGKTARRSIRLRISY